MNTEKLKTLLVEYGSLAVYTYLVLFLVVFAGFAVAMATGFTVNSSTGKLGVVGAAWLATKLTQPVRILASVALTPILARFFRVQKRRALADNPD